MSTTTNGEIKPDRSGQIQEMVVNAMLSRQNWMRRLSDPRRDIASECVVNIGKNPYNDCAARLITERRNLTGCRTFLP